MAQKWENGLCSCFDDMGICCMSCWCPCIIFGKTHYRLENQTMDGYSCCNMRCWAFGCCLGTPVNVILQMFQRQSIRERYNLEGGCCGDCMRACCCSCCELAQEERELISKKAQEAGYQAPPAGMTYAK